MRRLFAAVAAVALLGDLGCHSSSASATGGEAGGNPADLPSTGSLSAFLTGFEGEIDVDAKESKPGAAAEDVPLAVFVKSGKLRVDLPEKFTTGGPAAMLGPKAYGIFDSAAKKLYVVSDLRKEVIVIDLNKSGEQLKGAGKGPAGPEGKGSEGTPPKITKTGKYDTVAGYKCENWDIATDHREGTACVAQEGVSWFSIPMTGIPTEHAWALELLDGKHFPLRFVGYGKDGNTEEGRIEVTKIDKKALPATQFEYPPAYKVVDLMTMISGMAGLGRMPGTAGGMPPGMPAGMPGMPMPAHPHHP